jgi:hypothetical protein
MTTMQTTFTTVRKGQAPNGWGGVQGQGGNGGKGGGLIHGDVATQGRLQQSAKAADTLAEQIQIILGMVHSAAITLPERLAAADWGTDGITAAGDRIGDSVARQSELDHQALVGLLEQLNEMDGEITAAEQLGAEVLARRADGAAEALAGD